MNQRVVVLENIRSLHNVGAIFRTADGAGWDKVYLCGITGTPPDERIAKVSLEAEGVVDWEYAESAEDVCKKLQSDGFVVCALEQTTKAENLLEAQAADEKLALVLGNEVDGVSPEVLRLCDRFYEIPMRGHKTSLNVSVAAGVAMYKLVESRE